MFKLIVVVALFLSIINSGGAIKCHSCLHTHLSNDENCKTAKGSGLGTCDGSTCYTFKGSGHVGNTNNATNITTYQYREMVQRGCGTMAVCNSFNDNILRLPIGNSSNVTSSCTTCDKQNCNNNSGNGIFLNKVSMAIILLYFGMKTL